MNNSSKVTIGIVIGCCGLILIGLLIGGYFAYNAISKQVKVEQEKAKIEEEKKQTEQDIIEYNNLTVDLRNDVVFALEHLTNTITADESAASIESANGELTKKINKLKDHFATPSKSDELNQLIKEYLVICDQLTAKVKEMVTNYADTPKFNANVDQYNLLIDDLNAKNDEINVFADSLNTTDSSTDYSTDDSLYESSFDYDYGV